MKITLKTGLALLFGSVILSSCENCDTATITPIQEQDIEWLVYDDNYMDAVNDTIRYVNKDNKEVKYVRTSVFSNNVPGQGHSFDDKCVEQMDTQAQIIIRDASTSTTKMPALATYVLRRPNSFDVKILVDQLGTFDIDEANPTHASLKIGDYTYENVYVVEKTGDETNDKGKLKKLYFNKTFGFIRVEYFGGSTMELKRQ